MTEFLNGESGLQQEAKGSTKEPVPLIVALFVTVLGMVFLALPYVSPDVLQTRPPGQYYLTAFAVFLMLSGCFFILRWYQGKLSNLDAKSVIEVRLEAVARQTDPVMLARIVKDSPVPEVKEAAKKRLEEIEKENSRKS